VDWDGAPPQFPRGGGNCTFGYSAAHTTYPLKCMLSPEVPSNAGAYRPFTVRATPGSALNCDKPVAVNTRTRTGWYLAPNLFMALGRALPGQVQAFTGLPASITTYGVDRDGTTYNDHLFQGGGQGGSQHGDGKSGLLWPTSAANTAVEIFEVRCPILVLFKEYVADTGGPGRHRGGLGQRLRIRKLYDDGRIALAGMHLDGVLTPTPGLFGGAPGGPARAVLLDPTGQEGMNYGIGGLVTLRTPADLLEVQISGGSGYGDPKARPPDLVQQDLDGGYITPAAAKETYGCVVGPDGRIDPAATAAWRRP
jgi:5-oxoprolinase (ATP-hydrolysing)/N-methylhydantoinase A